MCVCVGLWASLLLLSKLGEIVEGFCVYSRVSINGCGYIVTHFNTVFLAVFESCNMV